jgi:hypothetical protein
MGSILELIKLIYGSKALSKVLGTRTNVIRLPDNELKQYTKQELNIEAASDKLAQKAKADMYELLAEYPRMNDAERLIFDGNLKRLGNKLGVTQKKQGPAADVLEFGTGEKVSPEGIMSLTEKAGQKNPPTTLMGKLESRVKQLEASGEDLSKLKGKTYDEFMKDITQGQKSMRKLEDEGLVRATAREIINRDIKSGKIKLPKEIEQDMVQGGGEPINVLRQFYGEDALEQLDSMVPELRNFYTAKEAADAANKKFKFEFKADRLPESISIEDARKAEQEFKIIPADSEEGKVITEKLIGKPKASVTELVTAEKIISDMKKMDPMDAMKEANKVLKKEGKYKNLQEKDVERIMEDTNDFIFGRDIPEDPEGFAIGGRVNFQKGTDPKKTKMILDMLRRGADIDTISTITGATIEEINNIAMKAKPISTEKPVNPEEGLSKNKTYSEIDILSNIEAKFPGGNTRDDTIYNPMPNPVPRMDNYMPEIYGMDNPKDVARYRQVPLQKGGTVSNGLDYLSGIERRGYAGGSGPKIPGKLGKIVSMAERLWQGARRTGDTKYDAQMVAEEIAETLFKKDFYDLPQAKQMELYRVAYDNAPRPPVRSASPKGGIIDISDPETASDFANFAKQNDPEGYKKIEDMVNEINQKREATKGMSLEDEMNMILNQYDKSMFIKNEQGMVDVANPENIQKMALLLQKDHPNLYKKLQEQASQVDTIENFDITGRKPNAEGGLQGLNYLTGL